MTAIQVDRDEAEQAAWYAAIPPKYRSHYVDNKVKELGLTAAIAYLVTTQHPEVHHPDRWGGIEHMLEWAPTQWPALYEPEVCQRALLHIQYWKRYALPKGQ